MSDTSGNRPASYSSRKTRGAYGGAMSLREIMEAKPMTREQLKAWRKRVKRRLCEHHDFMDNVCQQCGYIRDKASIRADGIKRVTGMSLAALQAKLDAMTEPP